MKSLLMERCDQCGAAVAVEPIVGTSWEEDCRTIGYRILVCPDNGRDEPAWIEWEESPVETIASARAEMGVALLAHYRAWHQSPEEAADVAELEETVVDPILRQQQLNAILGYTGAP